MKYAFKHCQAQDEPDGQYTTFTGPCVVTGKPYSVRVPTLGILLYSEGAMIQEAFPALSTDDREFLLSGFSPEGWKTTFGDKSAGYPY